MFFITAIDTEFTGLKINDDTKPSLFDDAEARYKKLRDVISQITIAQLGKHEYYENVHVIYRFFQHNENMPMQYIEIFFSSKN